MNLISPDALAVLTIWAEAEAEPLVGKICVGEVIRNRMKRFYTSDGSIASTVAKRYQFSFWNDDKQNNARLIKALQLDDADPVVLDCIYAWRESSHTNHTRGAVLYLNESIVDPLPSWAKPEKKAGTSGHHTFYWD